MIVFVGRIIPQKGIDIMPQALRIILDNNPTAQCIITGPGNRDNFGRQIAELETLQRDYPGRAAVLITKRFMTSDSGFVLGTNIYSGGDICIVPSRFAPCELIDIISYRFGAVPVVNNVGGLKDKVQEFNLDKNEGTGFLMDKYSPEALADAIQRALSLRKNTRNLWDSLIARNMGLDFSWERSAARYLELFKRLRDEKRSSSPVQDEASLRNWIITDVQRRLELIDAQVAKEAYGQCPEVKWDIPRELLISQAVLLTGIAGSQKEAETALDIIFSKIKIDSSFAGDPHHWGGTVHDVTIKDAIDLLGNAEELRRLMSESSSPVILDKTTHSRLEAVRQELLRDSISLTAVQYAARNNFTIEQATEELDWLSELERETDNEGFYGIDKWTNPTTGLTEYQRVRINTNWGVRGSYDMRGPVDLFWTPKRTFYIAMAAGYIIIAHGVDAAFNITASHNPAGENGIKWSIRRRRGSQSIAIVGGGVRASTMMLKQAFIQGLWAAGVKVYDMGWSATPETYHALAIFRQPDVVPASNQQTMDQDFIRTLFNGKQNWEAFIAAKDRIPPFDLGGNNFVRTLDRRETQMIFDLLPDERNAENLEALQGIRHNQPLPQCEMASVNGVVAEYEDLEVLRRAKQVEVTNPFILRHNAWSIAMTRLGPAIKQALFDKWVQEEDNFAELVERIYKLELPKRHASDLRWPDQMDSVFWSRFLEDFGLSAEEFPEQPTMAIRYPFKGGDAGMDPGNGSNWRKAAMLESLGFKVTFVVEPVVTYVGPESNVDLNHFGTVGERFLSQTENAINLLDREARKEITEWSLSEAHSRDCTVVVHDIFGNVMVVENINTGRPDSRFPVHMPDPTKPEFQRQAIELAKKNNIIVFVNDEDVDRETMVDCQGRAIDGARAAVIMSRYFEGPVFTDVRYPRYTLEAMELGGERTIGETVFRGPVGYAFYIDESIRIQNALKDLRLARRAIKAALEAGQDRVEGALNGKIIVISLTSYLGQPVDLVTEKLLRANGLMSINIYRDFRPIQVDLDKFQGRPIAFGLEPSGHAFFPSNGYANDATYLMATQLWMILQARHRDHKTIEQLNDAITENPVSPLELRVEMDKNIPPPQRQEYVAEIVRRFIEAMEVLGFRYDIGVIKEDEIGSYGEKPHPLFALVAEHLRPLFAGQRKQSGKSFQIDPMDGAVIELFDEQGRFMARALVRNSNNEAVFGLVFEGNTFKNKHMIEELILKLIAQEPYQLKDGPSVWVELGSERTSGTPFRDSFVY